MVSIIMKKEMYDTMISKVVDFEEKDTKVIEQQKHILL